jgi:putative ABC transport system substrate-binding protein
MNRRSMLGAALALAATAQSFGARAQAPKLAPGVKRIGLLVTGWSDTRGHLDKALTEALREQGYVEGRNLVIERRYADGEPSRMRDMARELAELKLDAVVTTCTPSTRAMKSQTATTPIVMASVSDPVGQRLIASLAKPGANVTGTSSQAEDILPKMIEYFAAVLPRQASVAVLADRRNPVHARLWEQMLKPGAAADLRLVRYEIDNSREIDGAIDKAASEGAKGLFVLPDHPQFMDHRERIVAAADRNRMPGFYWAREFVEAGGLMSYGENLAGGWQRSAVYVGRIVRGMKPADLPVAQPTVFELVINLKTAKALGVAIPQAVLARADRVIE